jgi:hypothetical protein
VAVHGLKPVAAVINPQTSRYRIVILESPRRRRGAMLPGSDG